MILAGAYFGSRRVTAMYLGTRRIKFGTGVSSALDTGVVLGHGAEGKRIASVRDGNAETGGAIGDFAEAQVMADAFSRLVSGEGIGHDANGAGEAAGFAPVCAGLVLGHGNGHGSGAVSSDLTDAAGLGDDIDGARSDPVSAGTKSESALGHAMSPAVAAQSHSAAAAGIAHGHEAVGDVTEYVNWHAQSGQTLVIRGAYTSSESGGVLSIS